MVAGAISVAALGITLAGSTFAANAQTTANRGENRPALTAEQKTARHTEMTTRLTETLTQAVKDGKLTEAQKAYILGVHEQIGAKMDSNDITGADKLRDELKTWLTDNKIDTTVLPGPMSGKGQGRGMMSEADRAVRQAEMKTKLTESLTQAVTDGKLTEDQKTHILSVEDQIHTKMEAKDVSGANTLRSELKTWATEQNIDSTLMPGQGNGMNMGGHGSGMGRGLGSGRN